MVNCITLVGFLGKDPESGTTAGGNTYARFSVATSKSFKKGEEWVEKTEWHNIVLWNNLAEKAVRQLKKGSKVYVRGELTYNSYQSEGVTKVAAQIIADTLHNLSPLVKNEVPLPEPSSSGKEDETIKPEASGSVENPEDDDLPF